MKKEYDCRKCRKGVLDFQGHVFCKAVGAWGDLSQMDVSMYCPNFKPKDQDKRKKVKK